MNIFFARKFRLPLEFLFLFIFTLVISINISSNLILEWDAAAIWIYRVKKLFFNNNFYNLSNIPGVISYPHLGTYIWSFFGKIVFLMQNHAQKNILRILLFIIYLNNNKF